jgi:hypothetical protein
LRRKYSRGKEPSDERRRQECLPKHECHVRLLSK